MEIKEIKHNQKLGPLDGIKIVEYGVFHAGPGGGAILGDLGADVIKIESEEGDPERGWTQLAGIDMSMENGESLIFEVSNRNKKGICLDIKTEQGRGVMHRLIKDADVFLTNLRKTTKIKLGVDYESIKKINSRIIHASVSGYGKEGPLSDKGAYDNMGQAYSGMMYMTGSSEPVIINLAILDQATAISFSHGVITALFHRERTGIAQEIHISLYGTSLWLQHINLMLANTLGVAQGVPKDRFSHSPLRNGFCCKDGRWFHGTHHPDEQFWETFCRVTGQSHLFTDPYFTRENGAPKNYPELVAHFDKLFLTKTMDVWMQLFQENNLMFCPVNKITDIQNDPQAIANNFVVPVEYRGIGKVNLPGYPIYFSECQVGIKTEAPQKGEHTDTVLKGVGYSDREIKELKSNRVVKSFDQH